MPKRPRGFGNFVKKFFRNRYKEFNNAYGETVSDVFAFPFKVLFTPLTVAIDIAGSAPRGFGVPELVSKLSAASVFAVATLGTYDIALNLGRKVICQRDCVTCNGWQAMRCTMCRGSGRVHYQVKNCHLKSGEKATAESVADAIVNNQAELVHIPSSSFDPQIPLPSKDCPICDGTGVMGCPECKNKLPFKISADGIMEPHWQARNVLEKMDYPYEHIRDSMKDPDIAEFWLIAYPQIMYGFTYGDNAKETILSEYEESRWDQLRDEVATRKPGWEFLNDALISIDPDRARDDPVIGKNIPYYKAKKALEKEVMKLDPPPRPSNWGELDLPLSPSSWDEEDLKNPEKLHEMNVLLNAQREISENILDVQWETKWRQEKVNEMLEEKLQPYIQNIDNEVLSEPILLKSQKQEKKHRQRRWFIF